MRYLKKIRQRLFRNVQLKIEKLAPQIPTYLCMENSSVWKNTMPHQPQTAVDVESRIAVNLRQRFPMEV